MRPALSVAASKILLAFGLEVVCCEEKYKYAAFFSSSSSSFFFFYSLIQQNAWKLKALEGEVDLFTILFLLLFVFFQSACAF